MHCQSCQHENPAEARFCMQCGSKLERVCPACQHLSPLEAKFCMACGAPLARESKVQSPRSKVENERGSEVQTLDPRRQTLDIAAERRQLTVMFCDVVGSTALSAQLDPEEFREVIRASRATNPRRWSFSARWKPARPRATPSGCDGWEGCMSSSGDNLPRGHVPGP